MIRQHAGLTHYLECLEKVLGEDISDAAKQRTYLRSRKRPPQAVVSRFGLGTNAAGGDVGIAGGLAAALRLAFVERAGQAVDQPGAVVGRTFYGDVAAAERRD